MYCSECYHGTSKEGASEILSNGFRISQGKREWLGAGIYFFEDSGSGNGKNNAIKWAYRIWYNRKDFSEYSIIKAEIEVEGESLLDLTDVDTCDIFSKYREAYIEKCVREDLKIIHDSVKLDSYIIDIIKEHRKVDVVKKADIIRFPKDCRLNINTRVPNCLILCVKDENTIKHYQIDEEGVIDDKSEEYL